MGQIYRFLGMSVGVIVHGLDDAERKAAYAADITYGTNNEFGFDYLRDNMKYSLDTMVQRGHAFAIVDEVDSILIDEARTPLIISGPTEDQSEMYRQVDAVMTGIAKDDYDLDEKQRQVSLTEQGNEHMTQMLKAAGLLPNGDLYDTENISIVHHVNQALKAHLLFQKDKDYIVKNDQVIIIDEFTGRMMEGRRYSEGLHQALEAKEHVEVQPENVTLASITFQNYFRLYDKLAGMTGTAHDRGRRVHGHLQAGRPGNPHQCAGGAQGRRRRGLSHRWREERRHHHADRWSAASAASRCWSAPPRSRSPRSCRKCSRSARSRTMC